MVFELMYSSCIRKDELFTRDEAADSIAWKNRSILLLRTKTSNYDFVWYWSARQILIQCTSLIVLLSLPLQLFHITAIMWAKRCDTPRALAGLMLPLRDLQARPDQKGVTSRPRASRLP